MSATSDESQARTYSHVVRSRESSSILSADLKPAGESRLSVFHTDGAALCEKLYRRKQYRYDLCPADCVDLILVDGPADEVEVIQASNTAVLQ